MKGKSFTFWERLYFRLFKGVRIVDIGGSYSKLRKEIKGVYIVGSPGSGRVFHIDNLSKDEIVPQND
jgi:hypothetical protein